MALDNRRQTILDIYCHIYQKLVDYLEKFEQASDEYSCYAIVEKCFELAIQKFGESPPPQEQIKEALLTDLLKKIEGAFLLEYSSNDQLSDVLKAYKTDILNTPISPANIEESQKIGEKLSQKFYQTYVPEYGGIKRQVELEIKPSSYFRLCSLPNKKGGMSKIILYFCVTDFTFTHYLNLPFYFLHEYLSHIHSACFLAENSPAKESAFEDGWLVYTACCLYKEYISSQVYKRHCLNKYFSSFKDKNVFRGYEWAENLKDLVGKELFMKISSLITMINYDALYESENIYCVQTEFLKRINRWLQYIAKHPDKKEEAIEWLNIAENVKDIFEALEVIFD